MRWALRYDPAVTAYLYELRLGGRIIHERIKELAAEDRPWVGAKPLPGDPGGFEINHAGHWIGFHVLEQDRTIVIVFLEFVK